MSNLLKIGRNGNLYLDGNLVTTHDVADVNEYLMQLLGFYVSIEEGTTIEEVVHSAFGLKKFISGYFSEEYEAIRAFTSSSVLDSKYKSIRFYKSFKVEAEDFLSEEEFLYVLPEVSFAEAVPGETGYNKLGEMPIILDENITLSHNDTELKLKSKFTLLDVLTCVFDEMSACIKNGTIVTS
jgi:hypothetical protein